MKLKFHYLTRVGTQPNHPTDRSDASSSPPVYNIHLVMEVFPESLQQTIDAYHLAKVFVPTAKIKAIMSQVFAALEYLHGLNLAHRDLNTHSVLFNPATNDVKVCDFRCIVDVTEDAPRPPFSSWRAYRAPELLCGAVHYSTPIGSCASRHSRRLDCHYCEPRL
eukprot:m.56266 g.56266  ORF g.56266 m.56266 type:complete len:164 (+) comp48939_c0_seq18:714-1205(+)